MKTVTFDQATLTEMKHLYVDLNCNLKEVANKFSTSSASVRAALADSGVAIRTRGRVKGKPVGARKAKVVAQPVATPRVVKAPPSSFPRAPTVDSEDELEKFLNVLRKD